MKKFKYTSNINIIFYNDKDLKDQRINEIFNNIGKRCYIGDGNGRFVVFMYKDKEQIYKHEKFYLLHELGHIFYNDPTNETIADEYAVNKMSYDEAIDALSYLVIDTAKTKFAHADVKTTALKNLLLRMKVLDIRKSAEEA